MSNDRLISSVYLSRKWLTSEHHCEDAEHLFVVRLRCDVSESDAREYREGEVERRNVPRPEVGFAGQVVVFERRPGLVQAIEKADRRVEVLALALRDGVEDAGQPVSDHRERGHQEQEYGGTVLGVLVDASSDPE